MAYSYYLDVDASGTPEEFAQRVARLCGVPAQGTSLRFEDQQLMVASLDPDDAELALQAHGFSPRLRLTFRHPSTGVAGAAPELAMFGLIGRLLQGFDGQAVLETQDPQTVLAWRRGEVVLNRRSDVARLAAGAFARTQWVDMAPL